MYAMLSYDLFYVFKRLALLDVFWDRVDEQGFAYFHDMTRIKWLINVYVKEKYCLFRGGLPTLQIMDHRNNGCIGWAFNAVFFS